MSEDATDARFAATRERHDALAERVAKLENTQAGVAKAMIVGAIALVWEPLRRLILGGGQ